MTPERTHSPCDRAAAAEAALEHKPRQAPDGGKLVGEPRLVAPGKRQARKNGRRTFDQTMVFLPQSRFVMMNDVGSVDQPQSHPMGEMKPGAVLEICLAKRPLFYEPDTALEEMRRVNRTSVSHCPAVA